MSTVRDLSGRAAGRRRFRRQGSEERERVDDTAALLDGTEHDARDHSTALATAVLNDLSDVGGTPSADQILTFDGTSWGPQSGASQAVHKSANESVSSSTTRQADDELLFAVANGETWVFEALILVGAGDEAADITVGFDGPGGSGTWGAHGLALGSTDPSASSLRAQGRDFGSVGDLPVGIDNFSATAIFLRGSYTATAAGNIVLMWAQNAASTTATTVLAHSHIVAHKV